MLFQVKSLLVFAAALMAMPNSSNAAEMMVKSPNGSVVLEIGLNKQGEPSYSVDVGGKPIVLSSGLGFEPKLTSGFEIVSTANRSVRESWKFKFGELSEIPDKFNELTVSLRHKSGLKVAIAFKQLVPTN